MANGLRKGFPVPSSDAKLLTPDEAKLLKEMIRELRNRNRSEPSSEITETYLTPEVYVAEVPPGGIPAMRFSASTPGSLVMDPASCTIYKIVNGELVANEFKQNVYNVSTVPISKAATNYKIVWRDKYGSWITEGHGCKCCEECLIYHDTFSVADTGTGTGDEGLDLYEVISGDWVISGSGLYTYSSNAIMIRKEGSGGEPYKTKWVLIPNVNYWGGYWNNTYDHNDEFILYACWADSDNHLYLKMIYGQESRTYVLEGLCEPPSMWPVPQYMPYMWVDFEFHSVIGGIDTLEDSWSTFGDMAPHSFYGCDDGYGYGECRVPEGERKSITGDYCIICYDNGEVWVYLANVWRNIVLGGGGTGTGSFDYSSLGDRSGCGSGVLSSPYPFMCRWIACEYISTHCTCLCPSCQYGTLPETIQVEISGVVDDVCSECNDWNATFLLDTQVFNYVHEDGCPQWDATSDDHCAWILKVIDICGYDWLMIVKVYVIYDKFHLDFKLVGNIGALGSAYIYQFYEDSNVVCETVDCSTVLNGFVLNSLTNDWITNPVPPFYEEIIPTWNCDWSNATITISIPGTGTGS